MEKVAVIRRSRFNAAHRLHNPNWSDDKNVEIFGKCNNPSFHGHNYTLFVKVTGLIDPQTGYVMDLKILDDIIEKHIVSKFDHRNLNLDTEEFKNLNPTAENIAVVIWKLLRPHINPILDLKITLYETENNFVEYPA